MNSHRGKHRRRAGGTLGMVLRLRDMVILAVCVLGLVAAWMFYAASGPASGPAGPGVEVAEAQSSGGTFSPQPTSSPSAAPTASSSGLLSFGEPAAVSAVGAPEASAPQRITYAAAGMDVVVHPLDPGAGVAGSGSIVPPETTDGYWLTPFGAPGLGSDNTTYVVGHSWEGRDAPFNHLSTAAVPGDTFTVATKTAVLTYTVDSVTTYAKSTLKDSPVWEAVPNRIVLISCYTADLWGKNVVVVASPAPGPARAATSRRGTADAAKSPV